MNGVSAISLAASIATGLYGLVALVGGIIGYVKASSTASLVAGGVSGILLLLCAVGVFRLPIWSAIGAIIISLLLLGRFGSYVIHHFNMEQLTGERTGVVALIMTIGGILVIITSSLALVFGAKPPVGP